VEREARFASGVNIHMKTLLVLFIALLPAAAYPADPAFPTRPIRIVVPFPPGGGSDYVARLLGTKFPEALGQNGVVDNRPGAASLLGTRLVAGAPNDGYTLLLADTPFAINQEIYSNAGYHPLKSFSLVTQLAVTPIMLVVHPALPAQNVQEFVALAKAQPRKLTMSNGGIGSVAQLAAALLMINTGMELTTVQYKGGGPALIGLMAGEVQSNVAPAPVAMPHIKSGKIRALGVASAKRSAFAPDVPTMTEAGVPGFIVTNWYIIAAPANTPAATVGRLHEACSKILAQRDTVDHLARALIEATPSPTPRAVNDMIASEIQRWSRVVKQADIRVD
jgi:tripartite-type tricarboxylate transporter receptor subunit TctC